MPATSNRWRPARRGSLLLDALRWGSEPAPPPQLLDGDLDWLVRAAAYHRISGYVLRRHEGDAPADRRVDLLRGEVENAVAVHMRALADLHHAQKLLAVADVPFLVMKGPVLAERYHGSPDLRSYRDLDLLVPGAALERVVDLLEGHGWPLIDRNWDLIASAEAGELHLVAPFGTAIDLHWQLLFRRSVRDQFPVDIDELFAASRRVLVGGLEVSTLDEADTLLHLCLHAARSGGHRLVWLKDVERAVVVDRPSWEVVVERARRRGLSVLTALVLRRTRRALGLAVPDDVLEALSPSRTATAAMAVADLVTPPERSSSRGSPARLLAKSARGDWPATVGELVASAGRVRPRTVLALRRPLSRGDEGAALLEEAGGPAARQAFFGAVAASATTGETGRP